MASDIYWQRWTTVLGPSFSGQDATLDSISFLAVRSCKCLENRHAMGGGGRVRPGIAPVLVVESDDDVRDVLHDLLTDAGCEVTEATTDAAALDFLAACPDSVVAVCSNQDADHHRSAAFFAQVVADERLASRHQYLMLSSTPSAIPPEMQTDLAQLHAPILSKPFDMETLEAYVHEAAGRLAHTHPHTRLPR